MNHPASRHSPTPVCCHLFAQVRNRCSLCIQTVKWCFIYYKRQYLVLSTTGSRTFSPLPIPSLGISALPLLIPWAVPLVILFANHTRKPWVLSSNYLVSPSKSISILHPFTYFISLGKTFQELRSVYVRKPSGPNVLTLAIIKICTADSSTFYAVFSAFSFIFLLFRCKLTEMSLVPNRPVSRWNGHLLSHFLVIPYFEHLPNRYPQLSLIVSRSPGITVRTPATSSSYWWSAFSRPTRATTFSFPGFLESAVLS